MDQPLDLSTLLVSTILSIANLNLDPCDDFYEFACGNYKNIKPRQAWESKKDDWLLLRERVVHQITDCNDMHRIRTEIDGINNALFDEDFSTFYHPSFTITKNYFQSCIDEATINARKLEPLKTMMTSAGTWPTMIGNDWSSDTFSWYRIAINTYQRFNYLSLISMQVREDERTPLRNALYVKPSVAKARTPHKKLVSNTLQKVSEKLSVVVNPPELGVPADYFLDPAQSHVIDKYRAFLKNLAVALGAEQNVAERDVNDVVEFERKLATITNTNPNTSSSYNNLVSVRAYGPDVSGFFQQLQNANFLPGSLPVIVTNENYLYQLKELLRTAPNRTVLNHHMFGLASMYFSYCGKSEVSAFNVFYAALLDGAPPLERKFACILDTSETFTHVIEDWYVRKYIAFGHNVTLHPILFSVLSSVWSHIRSSNWMDYNTKTKADEKLSHMKTKILYPSNVGNEARLMNGYPANISITANDFYKNKYFINKEAFNRMLSKWKNPVSRDDWPITVTTVNTVAKPATNEIIIPAAILQFPYFHADAPGYFNFGRIGALISHEIMHHYNDEGKAFGGTGNAENWWSAQSSRNYDQLANCFVNQYAVLEPITGRRIDGFRTLSENICDNEGLKIVYNAYKNWLPSHEVPWHHPSNLPAFRSYTSDQMFFINYAQLFCQNYDANGMLSVINKGGYAPGRFRVNIPLINFDKFSDTFSCKIGTRMNPGARCTL